MVSSVTMIITPVLANHDGMENHPTPGTELLTEKIYSFNMDYVRYDVAYTTWQNTVSNMKVLSEPASIIININENSNEIPFEIDIPFSLFENIDGDYCFVLADGEEIECEEYPTQSYTHLEFSIPPDTKQIEIINAFIPTDNPPKTFQIIHEPPHSYILPPYKQMKNNIGSEDVICKPNLVKIQKLSLNNINICVNPLSIEKLIERGWGAELGTSLESEPELQQISKNKILSKGTGFDLPEDTFTHEDLEQLQQREIELRKIRDNPDTPNEQRQSVSNEIRQMQDRLQYPFQTGVPYHLVKEIKERYAVLETNLDDAKKYVRFSVLNSNAISSEHHALMVGIHPQSFGMSELEFQDKKIREYLGSKMNILYEAMSVIPN